MPSNQKQTTWLPKSITLAGFSSQVLSSDKRKYPLQAFGDFWEAAWRYAEAVRHDALIHRACCWRK